MKKILLSFLLIVFALCESNAQWLPLQPIYEINYNNSSAGSKQMVIIDSSIFSIRSGGLQELNTTQHTTNYLWNNYYRVKNIVKDTGHTYVYLKESNYIGRYNYATSQYENIWMGGTSKYFSDIAVASDGKVWAVTSYSPYEVATYDGINWTFYPNPHGLSFSGIKMVNDTLACLFSNYYTHTFNFFHNGIFDSVSDYPYYNIKDWDVDKSGNIWIADQTELIHIYNGTATTYNSNNTPCGTDQFLHVKIGTNGHVWTSAEAQRIYEFDGTNWHTITMPSSYMIKNFTLNSHNLPWAVSSNSSPNQLLKYNNSTWSSQNYPFMPQSNSRALGMFNSGHYFAFANNEGIINTSDNPVSFTSFKDSASFPYANEVNCFVDNSPYAEYGTNHGIGNFNAINNALLPNDTINSACYDNGTYYIGTNNGLFTFNGILHNIFNMSNAPLPSNKITFVTTSNLNTYDNNNALYVGTDNGLAIYKNSLWTVYDTTTIPVHSFYVTGAVREWNSDSGIYVSTLGSGLIKAYPHGGYEIYNTANANFLDDSLYYIKNLQLGECGTFTLMGTAHHGIAYMENYQPSIFYYDTVYGSFSIHSSKLISCTPNWGANILSTDSLVFVLYPCGAIAEHQPQQQLKWYQSEGNLIITVPNDLLGKGSLLLSDMSGRTLIERDCSTESGKISLDISNFATGIYLFRLIRGNKVAYAKVSLIRE